jgi:hypothetical protein
MRRLSLLIAILLLTSLACTVSTPTAAPTSTTVAALPPTNTAHPPTTEAPPTDTPTPTEPPTDIPEPSLTPTAELPADILMQMNAIQRQVIDLRGLQPTGDVTRALLSPEELRQRVIDDFVADYTAEEAADDVIELAALGLVEPGFDMRSFYIELLSEQIAGFYDNETREMYVVQGKGFFGPERLTYAHEYTHVLQDQTYDIENGLNYNDDSCEADTERCAAIQSLIEGDASLTELTWFYEFSTAADQREIVEFYNSYESPTYDSAPPFMRQDFVFPYNNGLIFVQALFDEGGWEAVDAAYQDLPVSTEQILHPERYPADTPIPVELPDLLPVLGDGWRELSRNVMGEWYTYLILGYGIDPAAQINDEDAAEAAAGWGGDSYLVYYNDATAQTVVVMRTLWESTTDSAQFMDAIHDYAEARFGVNTGGPSTAMTWTFRDGYATLLTSNRLATWVLAPDAATAQAILQALPSQ